MSSTIWTPHAVASSAHWAQLSLWRTVEAQHVIATRALVDSLQEQELLEALLEQHKPAVPAVAAALDYLLYTPFRYPPLPEGSRFRGYPDPGVWYGADAVRTACAEVGYWRWNFVMNSEGLQRLDAVPHTIFQAMIMGSTVDLRREPFRRDERWWTDPVDYGHCQEFARVARRAKVQLIRYRSVRDPKHGAAGAVLNPAAFSMETGVMRRQTWFLTVDRRGVSWVRIGAHQSQTQSQSQTHSFEFTFDAVQAAPPPVPPVPPSPTDPGPA